MEAETQGRNAILKANRVGRSQQDYDDVREMRKAWSRSGREEPNFEYELAVFVALSPVLRDVSNLEV